MPSPPANPTNPPTPTAMLRPIPQNVSVELEHLDVAAPIPAPAPAPTAPKIKALRKRWLLSSTVTRATFSLGMPMTFDPSRIWMASSVTVEKVPTCFFMPVSTSSIFSPDRRPYNAFQSPFLSWARSEQGNRIRKHINAALRIFKPLSFLRTPIRNRLNELDVPEKRLSVLAFMGFGGAVPRRFQHEAFFHQELRGNHGVVGRARRCKWDERKDRLASRCPRAGHETLPRLVPAQRQQDFLALSDSSH